MMNYLNSIAGNNLQSNDIALQLNNVEILYTKIQKVYMKPQHKEERQRELRVNVEIHAGISPVCRKVNFKVIIINIYFVICGNFLLIKYFISEFMCAIIG